MNLQQRDGHAEPWQNNMDELILRGEFLNSMLSRCGDHIRL